MRICEICGKKPFVGNTIARRGLAKRKGGVGIKITGITRRRFLPNLQKTRVLLPGGSIRRINVCVSCLQSGKVAKLVGSTRKLQAQTLEAGKG